MDRIPHLLFIGGFLFFSVTFVASDIVIQGTNPKVVKGGENVGIFCEWLSPVEGQNPNLQFYKPDDTLVTRGEQAGKRVYVTVMSFSGSKIKLNIDDAEEGDSGTYKCNGTVNGAPMEQTIQVTITAPIIMNDQNTPSPQTFTVGSDAVVLCKPTGPPGLLIMWHDKDKQPVTGNSSSRIYQLQAGLGLKIRKIQITDAGEYYCRADAPSGDYDKKTISVIVIVPPEITEPPTFTEAKIGERVRMHCRAEGKPQPKFSWFKKLTLNDPEVALSHGGRFEIKEDGDFIINQIIEDDDAFYVCMAKNAAGNEKKEARLDVLIPPKIAPMVNVTEKEGGAGVLTCEATGDPLPTLSWRKDGKGFTFTAAADDNIEASPEKTSVSERVEIENRKKFSSLTVNELSPDDAGGYECMATTLKAGEDTALVYLSVEYQPRFDKLQKDHTFTWPTQEGGGRMECKAQGVPRPRILWLIDGTPIKDLGFSYYSEESQNIGQDGIVGTLVVHIDFENEDQVYKTYTCQATNDIGSSFFNMSLRQADTPSTPAVSAEVTPTTCDIIITVSRVTNGPQAKKVSVEFVDPVTKEDKIFEFTIGDGTNKVTANIKDLKVSSSYRFKIKAISDVGDSSAYDLPIQTPAARKPYPVQIISKIDGSKAKIYRLEWQIPKTGGSPITAYDVKYCEVEVENNERDPVTREYIAKEENCGWNRRFRDLPAGSSSLEIDDLNPGTFYRIVVSAKNKEGVSDDKPLIIRTSNIMFQEDLPEDISISIGLIILIVVIVFIVLFAIVDVTCYFKKQCGVIMCIKERFGGGATADTSHKDKSMEEGDSEKKTPLLDSDAAKDEVEEEDEIGEKKTEELEPEDKPEVAQDNPVEVAEEASPPPVPEPLTETSAELTTPEAASEAVEKQEPPVPDSPVAESQDKPTGAPEA